MGALRERFWERPLADLTTEEWEALCDGCGRCCLHKVEYEDTGEIEHTNVACTLLDPQTAQCTDYKHRKSFVPDCLRLTLKIVEDVSWLPATCAYRRHADWQPLPRWHYLLTGDREDVSHMDGAQVTKLLKMRSHNPQGRHLEFKKRSFSVRELPGDVAVAAPKAQLRVP